LADRARSMYVFTMAMPSLSANSLHSRICPSIDCSFCASELYLAYITPRMVFHLPFVLKMVIGYAAPKEY
jgi:hypothetical protein